MALVGKENTAKTGLALGLARTDADVKAGKKVVIFDFDNSDADRSPPYPDDENILIVPIFDETDDSIFNADMSVNWVALIDKTQAFVNLMARKSAHL